MPTTIHIKPTVYRETLEIMCLAKPGVEITFYNNFVLILCN